MCKRLRAAIFLTFIASCSSHATRVSEPEVMAVPLTAATHAIATAQVVHEDLVPPWSLTASDGSGLALARVEAKAVVEGPLAYTELHLWFHNPEARRREGTFQITLPEHAAVSRFAMETDGHFMEAEVVEKQLARRAYDDFLHRRQDPALLEKAEGNQFTAKVFPIAPNADKHIVISYSQELPGSRYTLPLRGLPNTAQIDVTVTSNGQVAQTLSKRAWTPDRDFIADAPASAQAVSAGNLVAIRVAAVAENAAPEPPRAMTLLIDTSASRALGYAGYIRSVRTLIEKVATSYGGSLPIEVVAFDQDRQTIYRGAASGWGDTEDQKLVDRGAAGASDLAQALRGVESAARLVVVTDGVITAGAEHAELVAAAKATKAERVDVVLAGGLRDDAAAAELVRAGTEHAGAVLDLDDGAGLVAAALAQPVRIEIPVSVPGAAWVYPTTIASARAGTSTMVFARLAQPAQAVDLVVGNEHRHVATQAAEQPLVERAVGGARIEELEAQLAAAPVAKRDALRQQIAHESVANRVISSQTSLLVLESADDYARYGIDQKALADVLVVGAHGLERMHQTIPAPVQLLASDQVRSSLREHDVEKGKLKAEKSARKELEGKDLDGHEDSIDGKFKADAVDKKRAGDGDASGADRIHAGPMGGEAADPAKPEPPPPAIANATPTTPMTHEPVTPAPPPPPPPAPPPADTTTTRPAQAEASRQGFTGNDHFVAQAQIAQSPPADGVAQSSAPEAWPPAGTPVALTGELATIEQALAVHHVDDALVHARDWHAKEPGNVLALIGLGDALEANGSATTAARVYGSIIDLYPGRADMRRFAGERLARLMAASSAKRATTDLVLDTYRRAVADRPDHLTGHRLLAYALVRAGKPAEAFDAILAAIDQPYRNDSYLGGMRVLGDDAGMIGATLIAAQPQQRATVMAALQKRGLQLATTASTRFILYWETDANDVDFHIQDAKGGHAYFAAKQLASGGELYADITTGYGPECFAIQGTPKAGPYRLSINYYSQGPMGYGMGLLEIQKFDGQGGLSFEDRPYVIMNDHAFVDLGAF
jgi:tetratricopeptide (TPR) repeat protein